MGKKKGDAKGPDSSSDTKAPKPATHVNVRHILCEKHSKVRSMHSSKSYIAAAVPAHNARCKLGSLQHIWGRACNRSWRRSGGYRLASNSVR